MIHDLPGKVVCDLAPQQQNPRNSEGAFITCKDGSILFIYSRFKGTDPQDNAPSDLYAIRSTDRGHTFSQTPHPVLLCEDENGINIMSVSLLRMQDGGLGLFYLVKETKELVRMYVRVSYDEGITFNERVLCTPQQGCFVVNNDRVIRLKNGDILIPAAAHRSGFLEREGVGSFFDSRADAIFFLSSDDGKTFRVSDTKCSMPFGQSCRSGLQEPGVVEIQDGILWGFARTDIGRQYEMFSLDSGNTWTAVQPSRFTSPCSPLSMKQMPDGKLLAVWNPIPEYNGRKKGSFVTGGRSPLVCAIGDQRHFCEPIVLEKEEDHGYCYCAIHFIDDAVLLGYCAGGKEDGTTLSLTRIRRIPLEELISRKEG